MLTKKIKNLGTSSFLYSLPQLVGLLGSLVFIPIFTKYLSPAEFGIFALMSVVIGMGLSISSLKIESGLYRYQSQYEGSNRREFLGTLFIAKSILGLIVSILFLILFSSLYYFKAGFNDLPFFPFIPAASIIIFLLSSSGFQLAVYVSEEKPRIVTIVQVVSFFLLNFLALYFVIKAGDGVWGRFKSMLIIETFTFILMSYLAIHKIDFKFKKKYFMRSIKFSLPLYLSDFVNLVYAYTDRIVLSYFEDLSKVGFLYISDKIAILMQSLFRAVEKSITPYIFNTKDLEIQKISLENLYIIWTSIASLILLLLLILSDVFIKQFLENSYHDPSVFIAVKILAIAYFITTIYPFFSIAIGIAEKTKYLLNITTLSAALNFILNITFIPLYGWLAAPLTTLACCSITSLYLGYVAFKKTRIRFNYLFACIILSITLVIYYLSNLVFNDYNFFDVSLRIVISSSLLSLILIKVFKIQESIKEIL